MHPSSVFGLAPILPSKKMTFIGEGVLQLLQYDEMCGSIALLSWSATLFMTKYAETRPIYVWTVMKMLSASAVLMTLFGGSGCAIAFTWARDELVFDDRKIGDEKFS